MISHIRIGAMLPALGLLCGLGAAPAMAQTAAPATTTAPAAAPSAGGAMTAPATPSAQSETKGATTGLGSSHRFATAAAATAHCPSDTIVWSSRSSKSYHLSTSKYYGKTKHGFYACKAEADDAGFHALSN